MLARFCLSLFALLFLSMQAQAEVSQDFAGQWRITVANDEDATFSGTAQVFYNPETEDFEITLIMQDACCGGNFARVRQSSTATDYNGRILIRSEIEEFLEKREPNPGVEYVADDFLLGWETPDRLTGMSSGGLPVIWTRASSGLV